MIKMELRLRLRLSILHEIEKRILSTAYSTISCENYQGENNNKVTELLAGVQLIAKSSVSYMCYTVDLAVDSIRISISAKYLNLNLSFPECKITGKLEIKLSWKKLY